MSKWMFSTLIAALVVLPAQAATADDPSAPSALERLGRGEISQFVQEALPASGERQLPRWHRSLCPTLVGFPTQQAYRIIEAIEREAENVGLAVSQAGCAPNIAILLTDNPDRLIDGLAAEYPDLFRPAGERVARVALDTPRDSNRTVRTWYDVSGRRTGDNVFGSTADTAPDRFFENVHAQHAALRRAIIIVDARGAEGYPSQAVADHLAMLSLGRFGSDIDAGVPTILNLFDSAANPKSTPTGMSPWDRHLLGELYTVRADVRASQQQDRITYQLVQAAAR